MGGIFKLFFGKKMLSGGKFATTLSLAAFAFKMTRKISGNEPKTLFTHELKPGEALVVSETKKH